MVVLLSLRYSIVMVLLEVIHPRMFPPFWFGGVTHWYQSFVYSELSIYRTTYDIQTINANGTKNPLTKHFHEQNTFF